MPIPQSTGYIVPPNPTPTEFQTYLMCMPTDGQWIATVNAALYLLTDPDNWDKTTEDGQDADVNAAVETARKIVLNFVFQTIEECMTICELVADCIETDIATQQAIANAILSSSVIQNALKQYASDAGSGNGNVSQPLSPTIMGGNIIPQNALCTDENKYAMARAIVQQLDSLATDFLEVIALITEKKKIAAELVENVPIFGGIASAALDVAAWIDTWVKSSYAAAYNSTTEVDYSCVIYCAYDGCDLSWDTVIASYEEQASVSIPQTDDFLTFVNWLVTDLAPATDNLIVGAMHLFILNAIKWGSSFMGSGVWTALEIAIEDAADEEISVPAECECAPVEWCWELPLGSFTNFDWSISGGFQAAGTFAGGTWTASTVSAGSGKVTAIGIEWNLSEDVIASRVEMDVNGTAGVGIGQTPYSGRLIARNNGVDQWDTGDQNLPNFDNTPKTLEYTVDQDNIDYVRFMQVVDNTSGTPTGSGSCSAIRLYGTGTPPSAAGNC